MKIIIFCDSQQNQLICLWRFCLCSNGKNNKIKALRKTIAQTRLTQRQVKKVMVQRSDPCCRNTLQKYNVSFINMLEKRTKNAFVFGASFVSNVLIHPCHSSLFAKYWINVLVVLTFDIFQPKVLSCIVFNVKTVKPGTQPNIIESRKYFSIK